MCERLLIYFCDHWGLDFRKAPLSTAKETHQSWPVLVKWTRCETPFQQLSNWSHSLVFEPSKSQCSYQSNGSACISAARRSSSVRHPSRIAPHKAGGDERWKSRNTHHFQSSDRYWASAWIAPSLLFHSTMVPIWEKYMIPSTLCALLPPCTLIGRFNQSVSAGDAVSRKYVCFLRGKKAVPRSIR